MKKKVVIIGAGPAGLTAAYELLKQKEKYDVTILEASNQVGGISKTINYKGNRMDLGGHRFFSKSKRVNDFWNAFMSIQGKDSFDDKKTGIKKNLNKNGVDPEICDEVMLIRNRVSRIYYLKKFFAYPVSLTFETLKNMGFVQTIQSGFSYIKSLVIKKKEDSLENFYINRFGKKLYSMFFEEYTEKVWGRHPSQISADWGAQRVKGVSILAVLSDAFKRIFHIQSKKVETSLIEQFYYPKYGPGQLWEEVAKKIENFGGKILYNHRVVEIRNEKNRIKSVVYVYEDKRKEIKGDIFISSMPIKDLIHSMKKEVPKKVKKIADGLPYRDFITVGLLVKKINLINKTNISVYNNSIPDCWIYVQEHDVKLGRIQIFNNWSPYMVRDAYHTIWMGLEYFCNENDSFWNMSEEECVQNVIQELVCMGIIDEEDVLDSHREKVLKAYPAYFDTYEDIDVVIEYLNSFVNLYCIGRNGQHKYNNMDHSMMCAFEVVDLIEGKHNDKSLLWKVNTEKEYHEEK